MVLAYRAAQAVGGLLRKAAVGFFGVMVVVGAILPVPEQDQGSRSRQTDPARPADRVVLTVPEGSLAGTLTIVDASGRELAMLTHWINDDTAVWAPRVDGAALGCFLNARGSAVLRLAGTAHHTRIEMEPDGTTRASVSDVALVVGRRHADPAGDKPGDPQSADRQSQENVP